MLQEERHNIILNHVNLHNKATISDLCKLLQVSVDTVRRDLNELEKDGKLVKVHGGAISKSFHLPYQQPQVYAKAEKEAVAKKALDLMKDGMYILLSGGTIVLELARIIPKDLKATIFTVSPLVALEIAQRSTARVILVGGEVTHDSYICTGATVISQLAEIKADICFIGANGISIKDGLTDNDWDVVQVKKAMIEATRKTAVLSIDEKLETTLRLRVSSFSSIDYLITNLSPENQKLSKYSNVTKVL